MAQDTSISVTLDFDNLLTKAEARAMGLSRATTAQQQAFTKWAGRFALQIAQYQHEEDIRAITDLLQRKADELKRK